VAEVAQRKGRQISVSKEVAQLLDSNAPGVNAAIQAGLHEKMHFVHDLFPAIPWIPEVIQAARRWIALDMLKRDDTYQGMRISQKEYDAEVKNILELLREKAEKKDRIDRQIWSVTDIPPLAVKRKSRFIQELFMEEIRSGHYTVENAASRWVAADILLNTNKITQEEHEEMVSLISDEIRESSKHHGITPSSSNALYGQRSSGPLRDQRRTT
jgi:hypothetical protein